ncbi:GGDEF domain-containing protein [Lacinutrix cladophorae]
MKKTFRYLKDSFSKFKKDALSKVFYDTMKYIFITFIIVLILRFVPLIKEIFLTPFSISVWAFTLICLTLIILSFLLANFQFQKKYNKLHSENQTDELTGLRNYKAKDADLDTLKTEKNSGNEPISLILIDIDNFKKFNEENNYEIADQILAKLGHILNKDSRITDETYRYFRRGDEFLIVAKQTTLGDAQLASERKRKLIQNSTFNINGKDFKITVCCGVTEFNIKEDKQLALNRLSKAIQTAKKKTGKNSTEIFV